MAPSYSETDLPGSSFRYWAEKFGRLSSCRRHYAPNCRCSTDDRRHDGMMQVPTPSQRSHSRHLESARTRFDGTRSAVSDRDAFRSRRASSFGYPFLSRTCDPVRRAPARRLGASRTRTGDACVPAAHRRRHRARGQESPRKRTPTATTGLAYPALVERTHHRRSGIPCSCVSGSSGRGRPGGGPGASASTAPR